MDTKIRFTTIQKKKKKRNVYSVSYTSDTESTIRFSTIKKKQKRNAYSVSYASDTDYTIRFCTLQKKNINGMCIPFHTPPTRNSQSVSARLKKTETECVFRFIRLRHGFHNPFLHTSKKNINGMCISVSYTSDTDYTTRFSKIQKKRRNGIVSYD